MKKVFLLVIIIVTLSTVSFADSTNTMLFNDVSPNHWGYLAISRMVEDGVVNGYEDGTFRPDFEITRAEFAKIFSLALEVDSEQEALGHGIIIDDVEYGKHWAYSFIESTFDYFPKIDQNSNIFEPDQTITREDAAYALAQRVLPGRQWLPALDNFTDKDEISEDKKQRVSAAVEKGIINGLGDGRLNPKGGLTRAQVCTLIYNIKYKLHLYEQYLRIKDVLKCIEYNINLNGDEKNKVSIEIIFDVPSIERVDGFVMTTDNRRLECQIDYGKTKNENYANMQSATFTFYADENDDYRVWVNKLTTKEGKVTYDGDSMLIYNSNAQLELKYTGKIDKKTQISFEWDSQFGIPTKSIEWTIDGNNIMGKVENNIFSINNDIVKYLDNKVLDNKITVAITAENNSNPIYGTCIFKYHIYDIKI